MNDSLNMEWIEGRDGEAVWFLFPDPALFSLSGYKLLQSRAGKGFLPCQKLLYNGNVKLTYDITGCKSLEALAPELAGERLRGILTALLHMLEEVRDNGFIQCENLAWSLDKVFLDGADSVSLIYLPIGGQKTESGYQEFEEKFRRALALGLRTGGLRDGLIATVCAQLGDSAYTFAEICQTLDQAEAALDAPAEPAEPTASHGGLMRRLRKKNVRPVPERTPVSTVKESVFHTELTLVCLEDETVKLTIDKPSFLIGKNPHAVNGLIQNHNAVSRLHCKMEWGVGGYTLTDMGSVNGTFLNGIPLKGGEPKLIKVGDCIKIANVGFEVRKLPSL